MAEYRLQLATPEDIPVCLKILSDGRAFQRKQGFTQWQDGYPARSHVEADIEKSGGYVLQADGKIAAYLYIGFDGDPSYDDIDGAWYSSAPYAVVHRVAISEAFRGRGLADVIFQLVGELAKSRGVWNLRIDTARPNQRMQHVLLKNGFQYRGTVIQNGGERLAFEKQL